MKTPEALEPSNGVIKQLRGWRDNCLEVADAITRILNVFGPTGESTGGGGKPEDPEVSRKRKRPQKGKTGRKKPGKPVPRKRTGKQTGKQSPVSTEEPTQAESFKSIVTNATLRCLENLKRPVTVDEIVRFIRSKYPEHDDENLKKRVQDTLIFASTEKYTTNPPLKKVARGTYDKAD